MAYWMYENLMLNFAIQENLLSSMRDIAHNISKVTDDEIEIYFKTIL